MQDKGNVLVVDDDRGARESLRLVLSRRHLVHVAESGGEALQILRKFPIDTVTLEPWLAGIQGRELLRSIRDACPTSRVILVTGQRLSVWFDDMVREEVFDYLPKPFDSGQLLRTVDRSLRGRGPLHEPQGFEPRCEIRVGSLVEH